MCGVPVWGSEIRNDSLWSAKYLYGYEESQNMALYKRFSINLFRTSKSREKLEQERTSVSSTPLLPARCVRAVEVNTFSARVLDSIVGFQRNIGDPDLHVHNIEAPA